MALTMDDYEQYMTASHYKAVHTLPSHHCNGVRRNKPTQQELKQLEEKFNHGYKHKTGA